MYWRTCNYVSNFNKRMSGVVYKAIAFYDTSIETNCNIHFCEHFWKQSITRIWTFFLSFCVRLDDSLHLVKDFAFYCKINISFGSLVVSLTLNHTRPVVFQLPRWLSLLCALNQSWGVSQCSQTIYELSISRDSFLKLLLFGRNGK